MIQKSTRHKNQKLLEYRKKCYKLRKTPYQNYMGLFFEKENFLES